MKEKKDTLLYKGRRRMLVKELQEQNLFSDRTLKAIGAVPRHFFVQDGLEDQAYKDTPVAIGAGQTISQPSTVALQTDLLEIKSGDRILEIGTGCGYQTAVLFYLGAEVFTIERQEELFRQQYRHHLLPKFHRLTMLKLHWLQPHHLKKISQYLWRLLQKL